MAHHKRKAPTDPQRRSPDCHSDGEEVPFPGLKLMISRCCMQCNATETPQWREGPHGPKTLCNACGVKWLRQTKRQRPAPAPPKAPAVRTGVRSARRTHQGSPTQVHNQNNAGPAEHSDELNYTSLGPVPLHNQQPDSDDEAAAMDLLTFAASAEVQSSDRHPGQAHQTKHHRTSHASVHGPAHSAKETRDAPKPPGSQTTPGHVLPALAGAEMYQLQTLQLAVHTSCIQLQQAEAARRAVEQILVQRQQAAARSREQAQIYAKLLHKEILALDPYLANTQNKHQEGKEAELPAAPSGTSADAKPITIAKTCVRSSRRLQAQAQTQAP